ncbi:MAG: type II secretion system protein [Akkermansiaceae bacterium]|nr:type II secretion system protein [Akkermansiaceae bacterium]MCP5546792.1 type II secretion system protein [Akkermansiaceae bacterium]
MRALPSTKRRGFTLVELLVVIAIVAGLAAVATAAFQRMRAKAADLGEVSRMRSLGLAIHGWASEHQGRAPRSSHSAIGHRELGWMREILPRLGYDDTDRDTLAAAKEPVFGIDPDADPPRSPMLNVYFELDPDYDDYEGAPATWRVPSAVSAPASTVLLAMAHGREDHLMAQYFAGTMDDLPAARPGSDVGCVVWVDGHVTLESGGALFDSKRSLDRFHPDKAGKPEG